jgi:hypothetical protein
MALGFSRLVCIDSSCQYPRLVTPIRLRTSRDTGTPPKSGARETAGGAACWKAPPHSHQREYSSTISDSLMSAPNSSRSGAFLKTPSSLVTSTLTQPGSRSNQPASRRPDAQLLLGLFAHGNHVTGLDHVRRDVHDSPLTVTALCDTSWRASARVDAEAHAVDHVVQARFQQDQQQVGTGVALAALGLGEVAAELRSSTPYMRLTFCFSRSCRPKSDVRDRRCGHAGQAWNQTSPCR